MAVAAAAHRLILSYILLLLVCFCCSINTATPQTLAFAEVQILKQVGFKLKIGWWDFNVDPCSGRNGWSDSGSHSFASNSVTCGGCDVNNVCHVVSILLKSQNLTGVLPLELANLPSLVQIDLTRNYISGPIPPEWGSLSLVNISLGGNRLTGFIPSEIGNIATLKSLVLENNLLQGPIPSSLGRLTSLTRLIISANDFTGELPISLGNLKSLTDFRIDGTGISGIIPTFMGNWAGLKSLLLQGTSMEGSFPSALSTLKLNELRVSDFNGDGSFPPLESMIDLHYLILRNCSLSGSLPAYIGSMKGLKELDLSFNKFTGEIPSSYLGLDLSINYMYLTNNMLSGAIPSWILASSQTIDLSYNNFLDSSAPTSCEQKGTLLNVVASCSSSANSMISPCLRKNFPCSGNPTNQNLFINCGGSATTVGDSVYDGDTTQSGTSTFFLSYNKNWAMSSTGHFFDNSDARYIATSNTVLNMRNPEIYMTARLSASSLKYYGLCLVNGNYTVNLHFAEIMFTDDLTYCSVGRRFFDVSIQGRKVMEDFNIAAEANGTGREVVKSFITYVKSNTLEIHLQWSGKGTNSIPQKGVYGPLISAITVTPWNGSYGLPPGSEDGSYGSSPGQGTGGHGHPPGLGNSGSWANLGSNPSNKLPGAAGIAGITVGSFLALFVLVIFLFTGGKRSPTNPPSDPKPLDSNCNSNCNVLPAESKPSDGNGNVLPAESKPSDGNNNNVLPAESKPSDGNNNNVLPAESKPSDGNNNNVLPAESKPSDGNDNVLPAESKPSDGNNNNVLPPSKSLDGNYNAKLLQTTTSSDSISNYNVLCLENSDVPTNNFESLPPGYSVNSNNNVHPHSEVLLVISQNE